MSEPGSSACSPVRLRMSRFLRSARLLWLASSLVLAACTGTREETLPTVLVIGSAEGGQGQLTLFEDLFDPTASPPRTIRRVPGSERSLPGVPVDLAVVDRNGARSELLVLVGDSPTAELHFFDLLSLQPTDPSGFTPSRAPLDVGALLPEEVTGTAGPCLVQVEVGGGGRYAALLDDGCSSAGTPEVYVIDLQARELAFALSQRWPGSRPLAAGIFVDQASDRLYFAREDFGETLIQEVHLAGSTAPRSLGRAELDLETASRTALAPAAGGVALLADGRLALVPINGSADEGAEQAVRTVSGAVQLLADATANLAEVIVFSSNRLALHVGDGDPQILPLHSPFVAATLEPIQRYAYLLEEDGIEILDLFPYAEPPATRLLFRPVDSLADPRVITWAFAVETPGQ